MSTSFSHHRLDVYRRSLDVVAVADELAASLPRGRSYLADQLRRAATSIPLNIAEGAGEYIPREKARLYRIAKRLAAECAAILDVCERLQIGTPDHVTTGRSLLHRIVGMLTRLVRSDVHSRSISGTDAEGTNADEGDALAR